MSALPATALSPTELDVILATQLIVAHAGERGDGTAAEGATTPRLGWWQTDLVSEFGGLDLLRRLCPTTWRWAALRALRAAAIVADRDARRRAPNPDGTGSIFHFGPVIDEQLDDHLDALAAEPDPLVALPALADHIAFARDRAFDRDAFVRWATTSPAASPPAAATSIGRQVEAADPVTTTYALRAALAPLTDSYPLPYFESSRLATGRTVA